MKPVLYPDTETAFDSNGIGILADAISATVVQELNGMYELTLKYPDTGIHASSIADRCILLTKPDPVADPQPFRIYRINPVSNGIITVYARHIAYDTMGIPTAPFTATSAAEALVNMKASAVAPCPFTFTTDKNTSAQIISAVPKSIWTLLGGSRGSLLDTYGGEYEFDGFNIHLHSKRGADRGVSIRYGKNLTTLEQDRNCSKCYTGVYPYWLSSEGKLVQLPEKAIHAAGTFNHVHIMTLDLSSEWEEAPTGDQLRKRAEKYMADNDIGVPDVSWKVEFVQLEQTEEYKGKALLERVLLGDTVSVVFPRMNVNAAARAVRIEFDSILERYNSVTLGKVRSNLADTLAKQKEEIEKKPSETVLNSIITKLGDTITGAKGGAVRFLDSDGDGLPDELYIADNPDPALAIKVWRYNYEGWASSVNGYNGPFTMGATLADGLLAEFVTAAHLTAGTIQSKDAETFFLDLDNGILRIKSVNQLTEDMTELKQRSDAITISVQKILSEGISSVTTTTGYTFNADGLNISKSGHEMANRLDNTGMYVTRSGDPMLQANADGVIAADVTVRNYLIMGTHARFEDYSDGADSARTGCFWI